MRFVCVCVGMPGHDGSVCGCVSEWAESGCRGFSCCRRSRFSRSVRSVPSARARCSSKGLFKDVVTRTTRASKRAKRNTYALCAMFDKFAQRTQNWWRGAHCARNANQCYFNQSAYYSVFFSQRSFYLTPPSRPFCLSVLAV